ncbi:hypothetical protein [Streptosporangium amethystogenes]|uniref:hypothetical protein n=1 Tax=Streptosporangium amethystogenes TaxID=2002 RepID=UPI0012FB140A|nr:hypothetical protein [Streptosporangium amethystogenes]
MSRFSKPGKRIMAVVLGVLAAFVISGATSAPAQAQPNDGYIVWEWCFDWEDGFFG